jgi:hypothetical protein
MSYLWPVGNVSPRDLVGVPCQARDARLLLDLAQRLAETLDVGATLDIEQIRLRANPVEQLRRRRQRRVLRRRLDLQGTQLVDRLARPRRQVALGVLERLTQHRHITVDISIRVCLQLGQAQLERRDALRVGLDSQLGHLPDEHPLGLLQSSHDLVDPHVRLVGRADQQHAARPLVASELASDAAGERPQGGPFTEAGTQTSGDRCHLAFAKLAHDQRPSRLGLLLGGPPATPGVDRLLTADGPEVARASLSSHALLAGRVA